MHSRTCSPIPHKARFTATLETGASPPDRVTQPLLRYIRVSAPHTLGGFFASGFKRAFELKDFGDTIPGHGGITDRFDCQV